MGTTAALLLFASTVVWLSSWVFGLVGSWKTEIGRKAFFIAFFAGLLTAGLVTAFAPHIGASFSYADTHTKDDKVWMKRSWMSAAAAIVLLVLSGLAGGFAAII